MRLVKLNPFSVLLIQVVHLDEDAILRNEVEQKEYDRMITMLIAIPATVLPACCCLWLCRRYCDPKSRLREATVKYAPGSSFVNQH